ncbi:DUF1659 domain-containing protein [Sporosarcina sp. FSL W8-0480]|uniref:DUF1659 domain-containing protein n=1 Tax=Sporosarcina sp. FSL W8-0480 TaxID=2954701 RepID=UPI0030DBE47D
MASIEFRNAVGKVYFDGGITHDGKLIKKTKSYRGIAEGVTADSLYIALTQLAQLSEYPLIGAERVETAELMN